MNDVVAEQSPKRLMRRLGEIPPETPIAELEEVFFRAIKRSSMHTARYRGHLAAAQEMLDRRVRLAYAILATSVPLFIAYGARIALGSTGFDLSRMLIPLVGIALCWVAQRVERGHFRKNGESLIMATAMEEEDDSSLIDGPGRLGAAQHTRGYGLSSVGAAATVTWLVWLAIACVEMYRM